MTVKEMKAIINSIDIDDVRDVTIRIMYGDGSGYCVEDIKNFKIMNGNLVFTVDPDTRLVKMY